MKIAFFGLGGVGGYMAAQATHYYREQSDIKFYYLARGAHLEAIRANGLRLEREGHAPLVVHPELVTDKPEECGFMDYLVFCTKTYSVAQSIETLRPMIGPQTVIITFMNGVDGAIKLRQAFPMNVISEGCVYIYSKILSPGVIQETGSLAHYQVGADEQNQHAVRPFFELMQPAIDRITYHDDIQTVIWVKFSYISPFATMTTQLNITAGDVVNSEKYQAIFQHFCDEFEQVAKFKVQFPFEESLYERNFKFVQKSPVGATSSMQRDFYSGHACELDSLTRYISYLGRQVGVSTPYYDEAGRLQDVK